MERWLRLADRLHLPRESVSVLGAVAVGLGSSAGVLVFKQLIRWIHQGMFDALGSRLGSLGPGWVVLIPALGGLLVGMLQQFVLPQERLHGVASIMEAVALAGGRLRYRWTPLKALTSAISIGAGASVGPEDPSVQIGASLGSMLGQKFHLSEDRTRVMVATGAAAGIATAFNAPIAGVFFAVELILGEYATSSFGMVVLGAVLGAALTRAVVGPTPAFPIPPYGYHGPVELPFYLVLGLLAAPVALAYTRALYWAHDLFHHGSFPRWLRPVLVGVLVGLVGVFFPQVFGDSYEAVADILHGSELLPTLLLLLLGLKILLTALSLGAGFVGGVFAPSLFLGAALGGAYGVVIARLFPSLTIVPSAFALVGMAAVLAGAVRAPVTAIMLLFEMTNDYRIILPLMFAVIVSLLIAQALNEYSVYTLSLYRKGIRLERGRMVDVLEALRVQDVMEPLPVTISEQMPLRLVSTMLQQVRAHGLPVVDDEGRLVGIISVQDIQRALEKGEHNLERPVCDFCTRRPVVVYPDESVKEALQRMVAHDIGRLPVVSRGDRTQLLGWLSRAAIIRAYDLALVQQATRRHRVGQVRLSAMSGAEVLELEVQPHSLLDGRAIGEVSWPHDSLVASVQRGGRLLIPHGDTRLRAGDHLAVVVAPEDVPALRRLAQQEVRSHEPETT